MIEVELGECIGAWDNFSSQIYQKYTNMVSVDNYLADLQAGLTEFNGQLMTQQRMDGNMIIGINFNTEEDYLFFRIKWG